MAGRNRMPRYPMNEGSRGFVEGPRPILVHGPGPLPLHPAAMEEELVIQREEIHRILSDNRKLVDENVILQRELIAAKDEIHRVGEVIPQLRAEKESQARELIQRGLKLESELRGAEPLKVEVMQLRGEAKKLNALRQDLPSQIQGLKQELTRLQADNKQVPAMKADIDGMRQELMRAREATEFEKKANIELMEQKQAMEKNLLAMAREIERLRAALDAKKRAVGVDWPYGTINGSPDMGYQGGPIGAGYGGAYGAYGLYDMHGPPRH